MNNEWRSLSELYGSVEQARSPEARYRLLQAYSAVFSGHPGPEDQSIVLADLASKSGFYRVSHETTPAEALRHREGKREVFGHIFGHLSLSPSDVRALEAAAKREAAIDDITNQD